MLVWSLLLLVACVSLVLTGVLRRYALSRSLLDIPGGRSSHSVPTPRGGGVAIVLSFLLALPLLTALGWLSWPLLWALLGAGAGVAVLGFIDDHRHVAARWRLLGHFAAAFWVLFWLDGAPPLRFLGTDVQLGSIGVGLAALYLVWLLNLYNFMDGIDGLASIEAICVGLGAALLALLVSAGSASQLLDSGDANLLGLYLAPLLLAAAVLGFLCWNFPPARIFMGDAGSGFLGISIGVLSLQAAWAAPQLLWSWLILLGVFIVDATWTLMRRLLRGDKLYEAHRSHAYQYAARHYGGHLPVTLTVLAINLLWLLPIAGAVALGVVDGLAGLLLAYLPLGVLAARFRAGGLE